MFKIKIMIKAILISFIVSCSTPINWLTYTDNINHFKINYPDKWIKQNANGAIGFLSPKENDKDAFQENVNIMIQDLSKQPMSLEQYTALTKKQVTDNVGASAIVSIKDISLAGQQAKEFIFNMNYNNGQKLKMKQYWFIKSEIAYLISYAAEPLQYEKYENIATEMIQSFKFF